EIYRRAELRHIGSLHGNIRPGVYVPYTRAQQEALIKVLIWLKRRYPRTFRLDYVFGHDEVSPGRKVDPGGSYGAVGTPP
ncbi:N-acetylmuramoyl-L-alanine amidase, partial [Acinetobacter baumannii]